jgi:Sec-independent protein translocase protein TatA
MPTESQKENVSLGCGTLILIALIVLIFGGGSTKDLEREVASLKTSVAELKTAVDSQTTEIRELRQQLAAPGANAGANE